MPILAPLPAIKYNLPTFKFKPPHIESIVGVIRRPSRSCWCAFGDICAHICERNNEKKYIDAWDDVATLVARINSGKLDLQMPRNYLVWTLYLDFVHVIVIDASDRFSNYSGQYNWNNISKIKTKHEFYYIFDNLCLQLNSWLNKNAKASLRPLHDPVQHIFFQCGSIAECWHVPNCALRTLFRSYSQLEDRVVARNDIIRQVSFYDFLNRMRPKTQIKITF